MELLKEIVLDCKDLLCYKYGDVKWSGRYAGLTVLNEMKFSYNLRLAESQIIFFHSFLWNEMKNEKCHALDTLRNELEINYQWQFTNIINHRDQAGHDYSSAPFKESKNMLVVVIK